jgi:hypothetical protein
MHWFKTLLSSARNQCLALLVSLLGLFALLLAIGLITQPPF